MHVGGYVDIAVKWEVVNCKMGSSEFCKLMKATVIVICHSPWVGMLTSVKPVASF